jgi:SNF family Na+-dependent transporter
VKNGGGAFIIPYLVALLVMGLPLIWIEWAMGRHGGHHGHHSGPGVLHAMGRRPIWKYLGIFGLWSNLIVASYYVYIESWTLAYAINYAIGGFQGGDAEKYFIRLTGTEKHSIIAVSDLGMSVFFICIVVNVYILSRGLARGIELVAKVAMPLLILFAAILAVRGLTLEQGVHSGVVESPMVGLNFLWEPKYDSLLDPSIWLAAAGQIFFTLSIGLGSILCYASYLRAQDDIALTGSSAAWTNEFCEVVLGGTILIPIAVAYMGLQGMQDTVGNTSGLGLGFVVFPNLLKNFGGLAPAMGFLWFSLLFFAAITSSLAMGQPIMAFFQDEFHMDRKRSAFAFGILLCALAVPVAVFTLDSFLDEFDFWAGTFFLVVFALIETVLFVWVFGMDRGWAEINRGAEIRIMPVFYYVIKYVTPVFLIVILLGAVFKPEGKVVVTVTDPQTGEVKTETENRGWQPYFLNPFRGEPVPAWEWAGDSMIGKLMHKDLPPPAEDAPPKEKEYHQKLKNVRTADRLVLLGVFAFFAVLTRIAWSRRRAEGRD